MNVATSNNSVGDKNLAEMIKFDYTTRLWPISFSQHSSEFPPVGGESHITSHNSHNINKRNGDGRLQVTAILMRTIRTRAPGLYECNI